MNRITQIFANSTIILALAACGGGSSAPTTAPPMFAGTVSLSAGIAEQMVTLKKPTGELITAAVDDNGGFSVTDAIMGEGYLMRVDLGNNNFLYSIAHLANETANRQNIHSYTDLVARTWFADQQLDINSVFSSSAAIDNFPTAEIVNTIDANVQAIVSDVLEVYGLSSVTLSTVSYQATDTGVDRFLNENPVIIKDNKATIIVNDPQTNLQSIAVNRVALQTTFGNIDTTPPQQPQNLRALGASANDITLAWSITSDNIGITTYNVYRDDQLINHTPFPVYRDTNLLPDTDYTYTVLARDEANNSSSPSVAAIGRVLSEPDTTAPDAPSMATLEPSTQTINVYWSHSNPNELVKFEVTRTGGDLILVREVTSTMVNDFTVASGTDYCYSVVAVDASGNRSEANPQACTTSYGATLDPAPLPNTLATIEMAQESIASSEGTVVTAYVNRVGSSEGEVSIDYIITPATAIADEDYIATDGTLVWTDGDTVAKTIEVELLNDAITEDNETLLIVLTNSSVNSVVTQASTSVTITAN